MLISLKNKDTLIIDEFSFKCCIGKNGLKTKKIEGDFTTPKGTFLLKKIYYRSDRLKKIKTVLPKVQIKKNMGWCNDPKHKQYNSLIKTSKKIKHEKLFRRDRKYDLLIVIDYNLNKIIPFKGSAIFIHLTKNYKPTAGCIALSKNDMIVLLKIINKKTRIKIN
tara:strand:+ start:386 stop:877 length:492 start_codon:yes stop_codon:yes gene_type:complete